MYILISHRTGPGPAVVFHSERNYVPFSSKQKVSSSVDQRSRRLQWTSTSWKQLQQDHQKSLEQVDGLTAKLEQGQGVIRELEAQVARGQNQVAQLEARLNQEEKQETRQAQLSQCGKKLDQQDQLDQQDRVSGHQRSSANKTHTRFDADVLLS